MSIASRITSIEEHLTDDYNALEDIGADLTNVDKNIENIKNVLADIYDEMPKVSDTGTDLTLENTRKGAMSITYKGDTQQDSTTGKQLINVNAISNTNIVVEDNGKTIKLPIASSGNGYISTGKKLSALCPNLQVGDVVYLNFTRNLGTSNNNFIYFESPYSSSWQNEASKTITQDMLDSSVVLYGNRYSSGETTQCILTDFRITQNASDTWEPYTNGASPNPDYPQQIHNVSGDNTIEICGKNRFNIQTIVKGRLDSGVVGYASNTTDLTLNDNSFSFTTNANYRGATTDFISVSENNYIFNSNVLNSAFGLIIASYDSNKNWLGDLTFSRNANQTTTVFTISSSVKYIRMNFYLSSSGTISFENPQLEKGTTATEYEPYTGNSQLISLGVENIFNANENEYTFNANEQTTQTIGTIDLKSGKTYYFSYNIDTATTSNTRNTPYIQISGGSKVYENSGSNYNLTKGRKTWKFTIDTTGTYVIGYWCHTPNTNVKISDFMLSTSRSEYYYSYGTTPIELNKISTYQDYIYKENDRWFIHNEIGKVVLNGSEEWSVSGVNYVIAKSTIQNANLPTGTTDLYCNYFTIESTLSPQGSLRVGGTNLVFNYDNTGTDKAGFIIWLSTHNTIVYYVLAEPTDTEITDTTLLQQLETIKRSYDGVTNISQENNDLPFILDVSALKEWE